MGNRRNSVSVLPRNPVVKLLTGGSVAQSSTSGWSGMRTRLKKFTANSGSGRVQSSMSLLIS